MTAPHVPAQRTDGPHVQVVRGAPDEDELAALVAGLVATATGEPEYLQLADAWTDRRRTLDPRPAPTPGPETWRWSLHP